MWLAPSLVTAPATEPLSLEEVKVHLKLDSNEWDAYVSALVGAAVSLLDGWSGILGRCMVEQEWAQSFYDWPGSRVLRLPLPDVSDATLSYYDQDGNEQTVDSDHYQALSDAKGSFLWLRDSFTAPTLESDRLDRVRAQFTAGYGPDPEDVPGSIRRAMLLLIGHWHENREVVVVGTITAEMKWAVDALLAPHRVQRV